MRMRIRAGIAVVAAVGDITPDEADNLRGFGTIRNEVAHGGLGLSASREAVEEPIASMRALLKLNDG